MAKDAQLAVGMGLMLTEKEGERHWLAELHRIKGAALLAASDANTAQAEASFQQALDIARKQSALSLELRAAMALARLLVARGEKARAAECVAEVYSRFTEGLDTADLREARGLLQQWRAPAAAGA